MIKLNSFDEQKRETNQELSSLVLSTSQTKNSKKEQYKTETCKVLWADINNFAIDFCGFGITFPTQQHQIKDIIKVKYLNNIGESTFVIEPIFE